MGDADEKKNAEPSQNGTADNISDLHRMMQGLADNFQQLQQNMDTGFQQVFDKLSAVELSTKKI